MSLLVSFVFITVTSIALCRVGLLIPRATCLPLGNRSQCCRCSSVCCLLGYEPKGARICAHPYSCRLTRTHTRLGLSTRTDLYPSCCHHAQPLCHLCWDNISFFLRRNHTLRPSECLVGHINVVPRVQTSSRSPSDHQRFRLLSHSPLLHRRKLQHNFWTPTPHARALFQRLVLWVPNYRTM